MILDDTRAETVKFRLTVSHYSRQKSVGRIAVEKFAIDHK